MVERRTGPVEFPERVAWYGKDQPLPERFSVRAGPLTAIVEGGDLRYVFLGEDQVVLRLYAAMRDRNWNTIEPRFTSYDLREEEDAFSLRFTAEHVGGDVDFVWQGQISGSADGVIVASMDGEARTDFLRNRIGWCVLHPMELAGVAVSTATPDGAVDGVFPDLIAPHQPFFDMHSISHGTPSGGRVHIQFEGDLWEMEDQRNWTDASFKSYSTPLRIPYPVQMRKGVRVRQTITLTGEATADSMKKASELVAVTVDPTRTNAMPGIGVRVASHGEPLTREDVALLKALRPAHLHVPIDLTQDGWVHGLRQTAHEARALGAALGLEVIVNEDEGRLRELMSEVASAEVPLAYALVFAAGQLDTTRRVLQAARAAFVAAGVDVAVGGGTRAYFTELNRAADALPLDGMDVVGFTINPQVHAFDNASLTETLAAQSETVRSARAFIGARKLAVGPITLKPPFNPNATGPEPKPMAGELPAAVDARQPSLYAAGWLVGSLNALGSAPVDALTYFETTGWRGIIERRDHPLRVETFYSWPGMVFPTYHVLADVAGFRDGTFAHVDLDDGLRVQALALRDGSRIRVVLANMTDEGVGVSVHVPGATRASWRSLDDRSFMVAASTPGVFRESKLHVAEKGGKISIPLRPFAVATLDADLGKS